MTAVMRAELDRRAASTRIKKLHQILIGRRTGRLNDEDVAAANVLVDLDKCLAIRKRTHRGIAGRHTEIGTDVRGQARMGRAADNFQLE